MVELVDAVDSKSTIGNDVGVQVPPGAPSFIRHRPASFKKSSNKGLKQALLFAIVRLQLPTSAPSGGIGGGILEVGYAAF